MRTYVTGDIHGCFQEFVELLDLCSAHAAGKPARLITLGDYVDRGLDSFRVVRLIRHRLRSTYPGFTSIINLKGNHEVMMAQAALGGERRVKEAWVSPDSGGDATVEGYPNLELLRDDAAWLSKKRSEKFVGFQSRGWSAALAGQRQELRRRRSGGGLAPDASRAGEFRRRAVGPIEGERPVLVVAEGAAAERRQQHDVRCASGRVQHRGPHRRLIGGLQDGRSESLPVPRRYGGAGDRQRRTEGLRHALARLARRVGDLDAALHSDGHAKSVSGGEKARLFGADRVTSS